MENCELVEPLHSSKNYMSSMDLKREIAFFGMNEVGPNDVEPNRIKRIIENVKVLGKKNEKKRGKAGEGVGEEKEKEKDK